MNAGDLMNIGTMDDCVDRQRQAGLDHVSSEGALALPRAFVMAKAIVGLLVGALEGKLRMIEAGVSQFAGQLLADPNARSDEVGVESAL